MSSNFALLCQDRFGYSASLAVENLIGIVFNLKQLILKKIKINLKG